MALPKIGETISAQEFNKLPKIGETISAEQFKTLPGIGAPVIQTEAPVAPEPEQPSLSKLVGGPAKIGIGGFGLTPGKLVRGAAKVGEFLGFKPLGETIAKVAFEKIPFLRGAELTKEQVKQVSKDVFEEFTTAQIVGSTALFAANLALPVAGSAILKPFIAGQKISSITRSAALASTFSGLHSVAENRPTEQIVPHMITAAIMGAPLPVIGAMASKIGDFVTKKLPLEFFKRVFPTTKKDILAKVRTQAREKPLDPLLAREAMQRGFKGTNEEMLVKSVRDLQGFEVQVQKTIRVSKANVTIDKPRFIQLVKSGVTGYKEGIMPEGADQGAKMLAILAKTKGNTIPLKDALPLRRFLDDARSMSSFKMNPKLSFKQEGLKAGADELRGELARVSPKLANLMREERIRINVRDVLIDKEYAAQNRAFVSLSDILLGGGGLAVGGGINPFLLTPMFIARGLQSPNYLTKGGLFLDKAGRAAERVFQVTGTKTLLRQATFPTIGRSSGLIGTKPAR